MSSELEIRRVGFDHPDAQSLVAQVQDEYLRRYGGHDVSPLPEGVFEPPSGAFFVGYVDEQPVATGAWKSIDLPDHVAGVAGVEIKRMYVVPSAQRRGYARRMLRHLEQTAADNGADTVVLETGTAQPEAIALYLSAGYAPIIGFGHYRDSPLSRSFARTLSHIHRTNQTREA